MRILIVGCGYLGSRAARLWVDAGNEVFALTRSQQRATFFRTQGIEPIVGDVLDRASLRSLTSFDAMLYAVGYDRRAAASKQDVYVDGVRNVLEQTASRIDRLVYVSSSSVYGLTGGEWIDESSPAEATSADGKICLEAEQVVRDLLPADSERATILRFAGIYGPGRLLRRIETLRAREPINANPDGWLNLIHVDDGARIVMKAMSRRFPQPTYLVSDKRPVTRREYYTLLARLAGTPEPVFAESADRTGLNKRISSANLRAELGDLWQFDDITTGLPHAFARSPGD